MKNTETKKQDQKLETAQKDQPIIRVRSNLRAGLGAARDNCI
jgi:hypothetical protein